MQLGHMQIDLNSDLGEHYGAWRMGDDDAMLAIVTSANVACGFMPATRCRCWRRSCRRETRGGGRRAHRLSNPSVSGAAR